MVCFESGALGCRSDYPATTHCSLYRGGGYYVMRLRLLIKFVCPISLLGLPADVYYGRRNDILDQRAIIKSRTLMQRKVQNLRLAG